MRTQVGIIGAGPAGLLLSHLLHLRGISSVVLEKRSRDHVERRVRAGVLEQGTVDTLVAAGVGARLLREGLPHHGIELRYDGERHRIAFDKLVPGRAITVYGQQEVVKDLIAARLEAGGDVRFEVEDVAVHSLEDRPYLTFGGERLDCDVIAGCDGFHGVSRPSVPPGVLKTYERDYPFAWLGILAEVAPSSDELIYARTERGFALHSMRSPTISRFYLQVPPDADVAEWPDERVWAELKARLETVPGFTLATGEIIEKSVTPMRGFVTEPMQHGRLYLAGAHRAAHRRQGAEPGRRRRPGAHRGADRVLPRRRSRRARRLLRRLPETGVAGAALLLVDDHPAAHLRLRRRLRTAVAAVLPGLRDLLRGGGDHTGGELRRTPLVNSTPATEGMR
jgi:p-hydroxybenzoate 3-monooxygenase